MAGERAKTKSLSDELCQLRSLVDGYKAEMEAVTEAGQGFDGLLAVKGEEVARLREQLHRERGRAEESVEERKASHDVAVVGSTGFPFFTDPTASLCLIHASLFICATSTRSRSCLDAAVIWKLGSMQSLPAISS
jgi:precorrin-3B methylase